MGVGVGVGLSALVCEGACVCVILCLPMPGAGNLKKRTNAQAAHLMCAAVALEIGLHLGLSWWL